MSGKAKSHNVGLGRVLFSRSVGSWALLILLAKSEASTMQRKHTLVSLIYQSTSSCEHDFASSITFGEVERAGT
jgi:hypothetical protein